MALHHLHQCWNVPGVLSKRVHWRGSYELQESRMLPTIPCRLGERDLSASRGGEKNTDSKGIINCNVAW